MGDFLPLLIDLHVHSTASKDGCSTLAEIIGVAKSKGLDGAAITDHDIPMNRKIASEVTEETGFLTIPGIEITTDSGHLLVLDARRSFPKGIPFMEAVEGALIDGSAVIIPHPTDPMSHGIGTVLTEKAARHGILLETMNASTMRRYNSSAASLADRLSLPKTGGSDAHFAKAVGDAYTSIDAEDRSLPSVLKAIREGMTSPRGRQTSRTLTAETTFMRMRRHIKL
jgi:hypothetical protein